MEKWKCRAKDATSESVLPPTRRCEPVHRPADKKKDRKWSFGGLLRRISSNRNQDASSNDEDITYIPGHMLSERSHKKFTKIRSKVPKTQRRNVDVTESAAKNVSILKNVRRTCEKNSPNPENSRDSCPCNDSVNSPSSEGSFDATGKFRGNATKTRARAMRNRLCENSSSDDDSHRSNPSILQFRSDEIFPNVAIPSKNETLNNRRSRTARTERYIKRLYRDEPTTESNVFGKNSSRCSSNSDNSIDRKPDDESSTIFRRSESSPFIVRERRRILEPANHSIISKDLRTFDGFSRDVNENVTSYRDKLTWPRKTIGKTMGNEIYEFETKKSSTPPEPPPRSSKSRMITEVCNNSVRIVDRPNDETLSTNRWFENFDARPNRRCDSENDVVRSIFRPPVEIRRFRPNPERTPETIDDRFDDDRILRNHDCNSLDRGRSENREPAKPNPEDRENYDPRRRIVERPATSSLPKGVQLFAEQRSKNRDDPEIFFRSSANSSNHRNPENLAIPKFSKTRSSPDRDDSSELATKNSERDDFERKRSSKNLEDALSELEAIYNSLRLSDDDLLERAEKRSMDEYRVKARKNSMENSTIDGATNVEDRRKDRENDSRMKDDMAYRRMNPKERQPSSNGQNSISRMSYLTSSPNLSCRNVDAVENCRSRTNRDTPDLTRDDLLYRSINRANNTPKIIEPQPPFGIPLGPVTTATESDYLHVKSPKFGQTRSLYIPKTEPDVVNDDLAFRNLRKDSFKRSSNVFDKNNDDSFAERNSTNALPFFTTTNSIVGTANKKRAVRSMSADICGTPTRNGNGHNDWYNDYIRTTQKLRFENDETDVNVDEKNFFIGDDETSNVEERREGRRSRTNDFELDVNGNRSKTSLQRKIQVHVPRDERIVVETPKRRSSFSDAKLDDDQRHGKHFFFADQSRDSFSKPGSSISSFRSDDESSDFPVNDEPKKIESFTEQEISEYKKLCKDLEKLLERTDELDDKSDNVEKSFARCSEENNSQSEFEELEKLLIDDCELPIIVDGTSVGVNDDGNGRDLRFVGNDHSSSLTMAIEKKNNDDEDSSTTSETKIVNEIIDNVCETFDEIVRRIDEEANVDSGKSIVVSTNLADNDHRSIDEIANDVGDEKISSFPTIDEDFFVETEPVDENFRNEEISTELRLRKIDVRDGNCENVDENLINVGKISKIRKGENVDDESAFDEEFFAFENDNERRAEHFFHATNSLTPYHIVLCSLFLTLLITMIVAQ